MNDTTAAIALTMQKGVLTFAVGGQDIAQLAAPAADMGGWVVGQLPARMPVTSTRSDGGSTPVATITYATSAWTVTDAIQPLGAGQYHVQRMWRNMAAEPQEAVLSCDLLHLGGEFFSLIPAVSYNGNQWGNGHEPKGFCDTAGALPRPWVFGGDRASVPACTISECDGYVVALHAMPEDAQQSGCALQPSSVGLLHWLLWPLQEQPRTYVRRDTYGPSIRATIHFAPGESCTRSFLVVVSPVVEPHQGYAAVLDAAWTRFYHHTPARYNPQQLWALGVRFAKERLWIEEADFVGFSIGLTLQDGAWVQHPDVRYEIGWCGQNAGLAAMLIQDFLWSGNEDSWRRGAAVLDFWATHGRFASGLFYTHYEQKLAGILNPDLDTCNLGHGAYQFLAASELAEKAGRPRPLWRATALAACDFFVHNALPNGKLGRLWTGAGELKDPEGTIGCTMVWPLAKAFHMTGNPAYLQTAVRAYRAYADDDLAQLRCTAGALDTDCIDKETAFGLLLPGVELYEITGDPYFLRQAERAAYYLASWQWHHNMAYAADSPAAAMAYATFGGTSVSVQHHHLDPWGALIALGWLRLARATGKTIWRERAGAAWRQAMIGVSDGSLVLKEIARPAGGQDEGFYHTRWGGPPGGVSDWLVAWPTAFRLITLQQWPDWEDLS